MKLKMFRRKRRKNWWINRQYKDRFFKKVFSTKEALLSLYNAVNGTDYDNPDDIEINTIGDFIYMGMKNDVSFLFTNVLNLYEHQSTYNPNMPLRGFLYLASLYQKLLGGCDIHGEKLIKIPTPQFIVFYNGTKEEPDVIELKLSDSFVGATAYPTCLECKAIMLNINKGHNSQMMEKCKELEGYATLVSLIRENLDEGVDLETAVDMAVDECIQRGILADILVANRREVKKMLLTEYDEELHIKNEKSISFEEGKEQGIEQGIEQGVQLINELYAWLSKCGRNEDITKAIANPAFLKELLNEYRNNKNKKA